MKQIYILKSQLSKPSSYKRLILYTKYFTVGKLNYFFKIFVGFFILSPFQPSYIKINKFLLF